jgi:hypothetical protein
LQDAERDRSVALELQDILVSLTAYFLKVPAAFFVLGLVPLSSVIVQLTVA